MPKGCLKVYAVRFVEPPPVGTAIELPDGQAYRVVRHQPGFAPTVWRTRCLETGIEFEFATGLTVTGLSRRPPPASVIPGAAWSPTRRPSHDRNSLPSHASRPPRIYILYIYTGGVGPRCGKAAGRLPSEPCFKSKKPSRKPAGSRGKPSPFPHLPAPLREGN
jgi:hypothetical protein